MEAPNTTTKCGYCGQLNDAGSLICTGCGTDIQPKRTTSVVKEKRLDARTATIIFLSYLGLQFVGGFLAAIFAIRKHDGDDTKAALQAAMPLVAILSLSLAAAGMVVMSLILVPQFLKDKESTGAAWVFGNVSTALKGLLLGCLLAFCSFLLYKIPHHRVPLNDVGPLGKMALFPGFGRLTWATCILLIAPPFEELLFRGVMYGGYRKSFGPVIAAILTTVLFVLLHLSEAIHFPVALLTITIMASLALWPRIHSRSIGPSIALHVGYNATLVVIVISLIGLK